MTSSLFLGFLVTWDKTPPRGRSWGHPPRPCSERTCAHLQTGPFCLPLPFFKRSKEAAHIMQWYVKQIHTKWPRSLPDVTISSPPVPLLTGESEGKITACPADRLDSQARF